MSTELGKLANEMLILSQKIRALQKLADEPALQGCDLADAAAKLRLALPADTHFTLDMSLSFHTSGNIAVEWTVYDGASGKFHKAKTLPEAVNLCLAYHSPSPGNPVATVQELLTPMPF